MGTTCEAVLMMRPGQQSETCSHMLHTRNDIIGLSLPPRASGIRCRVASKHRAITKYLTTTGQAWARAALRLALRAHHPAPLERWKVGSVLAIAAARILAGLEGIVEFAVSRRVSRLFLGSRPPRTRPKSDLEIFPNYWTPLTNTRRGASSG